MKRYIGTKSLLAEPMTLGAYNQYRGWRMPADEKPEAPGFLVKYEDRYESWSPAKAFEAYHSDGNFNFGHALLLIKQGYRLARENWNGKDMFVFMVAGTINLTVNREPLLSILGEGAKFSYNPHIDIMTANGTVSVWQPSMGDCLAEDWGIIPNA